MKNPETKKKCHAVLKAAIWGWLLFGGLSLAVLIGIYFLEHVTSGDFLGVEMLIEAPTTIITNGTGIEQWLLHFHNTTITYLFTGLIIITINGLLGAVLFGIIKLFGQFTVKNVDYENKI